MEVLELELGNALKLKGDWEGAAVKEFDGGLAASNGFEDPKAGVEIILKAEEENPPGGAEGAMPLLVDN